MAKGLLWAFVVINFLSIVVSYYAEIDTTWKDVMPMWVAIGILALGESIESSKRNK